MTRRCQACGAWLSSYNPGKLCFPCQEKRTKELQEKWSDTPYYTLDDMCFLLGLRNPESVKRHARKGEIPGRVPIIKSHLWQKEEINRWIHVTGKEPEPKVTELEDWKAKLEEEHRSILSCFASELRRVALASVGRFNNPLTGAAENLAYKDIGTRFKMVAGSPASGAIEADCRKGTREEALCESRPTA